MGDTRKVRMSNGDIMEVELITSNYKHNNDARNEFIHGFDVGTVSDRQIESAIGKGWARILDKVGEWK